MKLKGLKSIFQFPEQLMAEKKNIQARARHQLRSLNTAGCQSPSGKGIPGFGATGTWLQPWAELPRKWRHFRCHHILCKVWRAFCSLQHRFPTLHFTRSTSLCGHNAKWGIQPCLLHRIPFTLVLSAHLQGQEDHVQIYLMSELKHDATFSDWFSKQALTKIIFNSNES